MHMKFLTIYTDGACKGNPGPGGWASLIQDENEEVILSGHESNTTNNRMEMMAVIRGLEWVKKEVGTQREVHMFSDSSLLINSHKKGWKRKKNTDLWLEFDRAVDGIKLTWTWVKGHSDNPLNQRVDQIAVEEAEKAKAKNSTARRGDAKESMKVISVSEGEFLCNSCGSPSEGLLGYMPDSGMIRVDCPHCGKYIKFAAPTPANLKRAKKRPLVTPKQLEALQKMMEKKGTPLTNHQIKEIKKMTQPEVDAMIESKQSLF